MLSRLDLQPALCKEQVEEENEKEERRSSAMALCRPSVRSWKPELSSPDRNQAPPRGVPWAESRASDRPQTPPGRSIGTCLNKAARTTRAAFPAATPPPLSFCEGLGLHLSHLHERVAELIQDVVPDDQVVPGVLPQALLQGLLVALLVVKPGQERRAGGS